MITLADLPSVLTGWLGPLYASIGASVGMDLWNDTQAELTRIRTRK